MRSYAGDHRKKRSSKTGSIWSNRGMLCVQTCTWAGLTRIIIPNAPPVKDWASTSAVKAVLGAQPPPFCRSSVRCSPSTFLHLPYKKLWRMSEVITSDNERVGHLNPDLRARASAGSTEPMVEATEKGKKKLKKRKKKIKTMFGLENDDERRLRSAPLSALRVKPPLSGLRGSLIYLAGVTPPSNYLLMSHPSPRRKERGSAFVCVCVCETERERNFSNNTDLMLCVKALHFLN